IKIRLQNFDVADLLLAISGTNFDSSIDRIGHCYLQSLGIHPINDRLLLQKPLRLGQHRYKNYAQNDWLVEKFSKGGEYRFLGGGESLRFVVPQLWLLVKSLSFFQCSLLHALSSMFSW